MLTILSAMASLVSFRFRRRVSLELEVLALRHQVAVFHRQRPGRARLGRGDRLLWVWRYGIWPRCLELMVVVNRPPWSSGTAKGSANTGIGVHARAAPGGRK